MDHTKLIQIINTSEQEFNNTELLNSSSSKVTFINPFGYHLYRRNKELYESFDAIYVDGMLMCKFINILYGLSITRRSFDYTSIAKQLFSIAQENGKSLYLIGASDMEIRQTISMIKKDYPKLNLLGFRNGFFSNNDERSDTLEAIKNMNPDFVIVGMGAVLQEKFIIDLHDVGYSGKSFSCGGYLRQASTGLDYYPKWIDKYNLRAFYRLFKEKGMFSRLYNILLEFPILFIYDKLTKSDIS